LDIGRGPLSTEDAFVCLWYEYAFYGRVGSMMDVVSKKSKDLENVACVCSVIANVQLCGGLNKQIKIEDHTLLDRM
jgi:hypothetical protein